jgi:hypothetical protein
MDEAGARTIAAAVSALWHSVHEQMREQVRGADSDTINWKPLPLANSITVLIVHTLGSEREALRAVRSLATERDRSAEFKSKLSAEELLALLDRADRELDEHAAAWTAADFTELRPRGENTPRPGLVELLSNYGHAREHLAQVELTKQLYDSRT